MMSFKKVGKNLQLPAGVVWLMNSISEYKGKQELYARQSPQIIKALVEMALIESTESSNRIEKIKGKGDGSNLDKLKRRSSSNWPFRNGGKLID